MSAQLLDVNALIALLDPSHVHHERAHDWFADEGKADWISSPTTENGTVRVVSNPQYSNAQSPATVLASLESLRAVGGHRFVSDDVSLLDDGVDRTRLLSSAQLTDSYLLRLAVRHGARLATFDRRISTGAVAGAEDALLVIP